MAQEPEIARVDRVDNGVVVAFRGGAEAFYSADLLMSILDQAQDISKLGEDENVRGYKPKT